MSNTQEYKIKDTYETEHMKSYIVALVSISNIREIFLLHPRAQRYAMLCSSLRFLFIGSRH